jgi:hypothetical protein
VCVYLLEMHIGVEALGDCVLELCHKDHLHRESKRVRQTERNTRDRERETHKEREKT